MSTRFKVILIVVTVAAAFAVGRYSKPLEIRTEIKTVEVEKKTDDSTTKTDRDKHREVTTTEVIKPDGTKETTTHTVEDTQTNRQTDHSSTSDTTRDTSTIKVETNRGSILSIAALAGAPVSLTQGLSPIVYGLSISREMIGPITFGAWGLSNATFGISVGLNF